MIVERAVWKVKMGCTDQLIELLKSGSDEPGEVLRSRMYTPSIGKLNRIAFEWEYENLAAYEKAWQDWWARPETAEFMEKWNALVESGGEREIWNLV